MNQKTKIHRGWSVVAVLCLLMAGCYGMVMNNVGVMFNAIMQDTGIPSSELSVFYTIRELTTAFALIPLFGIFQRTKHSNVCLAAFILMVLGSYALMGVSTQVWHWYILAVLQGAGVCSMYTLIPVVCNNWFKKKNGTIIGFTLATSGIVSAVFSPIASKIILAIGWRKACFAIAGMAGILTIPAALLVFQRAPQDIGLTPYGYDPAAEQAAAAKNQLSDSQGFSWGRMMFVYCLIFGCCYTVCHMMNQQIALYGKSLNFDLTASAMLNSATMIGNLGGKLGFGYIADKLGAFNAERILVSTVFAAFVLLCFGSVSNIFAYAGALLLGTLYASTSTMTLFMMRIYGEGRYKSVMTRISSISKLLAAAGTSMIAFVYETFGTFLPNCAIGAVLCICQMLMILLITRQMKKTETMQAAL